MSQPTIDTLKYKYSDYKGTPTYASWASMKQRCLNPNNPNYNHYGERGITVCESWKNGFVNFLNDMGVRPDGLSLDRINNDKGYSPDNCRWADKTLQALNRRNFSKSGYQGLSWYKNEKLWQVRFTIDRKEVYIGASKDFDNALMMWLAAREEFYPEEKNNG